MRSRIKRVLLAVDELLAACVLPYTKERGVLLTFLFHSLLESPREAQSGAIDPQQGITVGMLRQAIEHFQRQRYEFISPKEIAAGLRLDGKYALLTFDDGYYNNVRLLPVLEEFGAAATLFVSSGHVKNNRGFWWDVVYREGRRRGRSHDEIRAGVARCKKLKAAEIEALLVREFGGDALRPAGDLDRPFTPGELRQFASHRWISLGNHTRDHAILTNYPYAEARDQIRGAQVDILEMTGKVPEMIAYPNGNESPSVRQAALDAGLRFGIGIRSGANRVPLWPASRDAMRLRRFTLQGDQAIEAQCLVSRSGVSIYHALQDIRPAA
jgi:peptidoglycan/xylan/chitin deacetylase (PgdA/CDA1 family)